MRNEAMACYIAAMTRFMRRVALLLSVPVLFGAREAPIAVCSLVGGEIGWCARANHQWHVEPTQPTIKPPSFDGPGGTNHFVSVHEAGATADIVALV